MTQVKVEHYPELRRDEYSKGITNIDNDAYTRYMNGAIVRKQRNSTLEENTKEINALLNSSFMWDDKTEFSITVQRNSDIITLKGITGTPSVKVSGVINDTEASEASKKLRKAWLKN